MLHKLNSLKKMVSEDINAKRSSPSLSNEEKGKEK
jgi:hypothetical protein